ncbi:MAG: CaiB/BaiF CoA transferase family protein, partial [Paracoccaceae bacterium]
PDGQPQKVGVAVTDVFTGVYAATAVLAALVQRGRTGRGQHIDMALLDVATAIMANQAMNYLATGTAPQRLGNAHPNLVPYQVFACSDGWVIVAVGNDAQFRRFCDVAGLPSLADVVAYATNSGRVENRDAVTKALSPALAAMTKAAVLTACEAAGVPAGPINDLAEVFSDPQIRARAMQIAPGGIPGVRSPFTFSGATLSLDRPSPRLGQHDAEISAELTKQRG